MLLRPPRRLVRRKSATPPPDSREDQLWPSCSRLHPRPTGVSVIPGKPSTLHPTKRGARQPLFSCSVGSVRNPSESDASFAHKQRKSGRGPASSLREGSRG